MCPVCWMTEAMVMVGAATSGTLGLLIVNLLRGKLRGKKAEARATMRATMRRSNDDNELD